MASSLVTIGVPVRNEAAFVAEAVRSAALQSAQVIVSDNASTDATSDICQELAARYPNVFYVRHPVNLGASWGFRYCLDCARTPFFMWLGGHDTIPSGYCGHLLSALERPGVVLAFPEAHHLDRSGATIGSYGYPYRDRIAAPDPWERVYALIAELTYCTMLHGLWRTEDLRACWDSGAYAAMDHVLLCRAAARGPLLFVDSTFYGRRFFRNETSDEAPARRLRMMTGDESITAAPATAYHEMQTTTMRLVSKLPTKVPWARWLRLLKARRTLTERFGHF